MFGSKPAGGSLFGSTTTQQPAQTGGGLFGGGFGQQQNQQQAAGTTGGGLFGGANQQQPQQQQSGGLFGGSTAAKPTLSLFGNNTQQNQGQTQQGGLFGGSTTAQPAATGGSLFGTSTNQAAGGGGLFGGSTAQQPAQGGGLFGQSTAQPQQQQGGGLFGQSTAQQQQPALGGSLFGQPQQQQQQQQSALGGSLFGQSVQQQPQQQQQQGGLQNQNSASLFNKPQPLSLFSGSLAQQQQPLSQSQFSRWGGQSQQPNAQRESTNSGVLQDIQKVYNKWDKNSSDCEFKYYFYNQYPPEIASAVQKPEGDDQKAWDKAYSERPNPGAVPVLAYGFAELSQRVRAQDEQIAKYRIVLHSIHDTLNKIQQRHELINSLKLDHCRRRHVELARRALSLAAKVQVLKNRGYALQPEEEVLKKRLEALAKEVGDPGIWGRLNEIWARMTVVRERAKKMEEEVGTGPVEWDEAQLKTTQKLLMNNSAGLQLLAKEVRDIEKQFSEWEAEFKGRGGA